MRRSRTFLRYNSKGEKRCIHCKRYFPVEQFYRDRQRLDHLKTYCKGCVGEYMTKRHERAGHYQVHRVTAARRGSPPLSREQYHQIIHSPCVFGGGTRKQGIWIGVDRKDSSKGYTPDNVQPCCFRHNLMKASCDEIAFRLHLELHPDCRPCGNCRRRHDPSGAHKFVAMVCNSDEPELPLFDKLNGEEDKFYGKRN